MENLVVLIVIFIAALATGGLLVNWLGLGRAMRRLSAAAYVEFHQHTNLTFDPYMPIVVVGAVAGGIVFTALLGFDSMSGWLAAAGTVCYLFVIVVGVPTCVRINHQIARWTVLNPPAGWEATRAQWLRWHIIRTLFSLPGLVLYVLAAITLGRC